MIPGFDDGFAGDLGSLLRLDQILGVANRPAAAHIFLRKVPHEPLFNDVGFLGFEVDGQEPSLFPTPRLQGQIEPPSPPIG